jgi:pSer/pThr/pTyr-binding forkhead associated (FHA) protein
VGSGGSDRLPSLLVLTPEGQESHYLLDLSEILIGRDTCCAVPLSRRGVSRRHALVRLEEDGASVQDLGSTNGTFLNGRRLGDEAAPLRDGDVLTICRVEITFVDPAAHASLASAGLDETLATELGTLLTTGGTLGTMVARDPSLLDAPEVEAALLRIVVSRPAGTRLLVREESRTREVALGGDELLIGRDPACQVRLDDRRASTRHATIRSEDGHYVLRDLESVNGTLVNGVTVREHRLSPGDLIRIGDATIVFSAPSGEPDELPPASASRRPVVLIPGFSASEIWKGGEKLWPNLARVLSSSEERIRQDWEDVEVGKIVREIVVVPGFLKSDSFGSILNYLIDDLGYTSGETLLEFPYDWRQDNRVTARKLAETVRAWRAGRERPTEKVTLIAHSMGGLAARLFLDAYGGADAVEHCIFLGTPHLGSASSLQMAIAGTGVLPFGLPLGKMQRALLGFPAFYQLLPALPAAELEEGTPFLPFESDHDWLEPQQQGHLEAAAAVRRLLDARPPTELVPTTCIFGYRQKTLERIRIRRERSGRIRITSEDYSKNGDGSVVERSAVLDDAAIHPVVQQHGALYSDPDVLRRLRFELLERKRR